MARGEAGLIVQIVDMAVTIIGVLVVILILSYIFGW